MSTVSSTVQTPRTAIIFFTHVFDTTVRTAFEQLQRESSGAGDLYVLTEAAGSLPPWAGRVHRFDFSRLRQQYPSAMGTHIIPGNTHLPILAFHEAHPEYDYCWIIEYDVRFSGSWADFFDEFQGNTVDLLATHIRCYKDERGWYWWGTLQAPDGRAASAKRLRAFMPVYRISRRALALLTTRDVQGWRGHYECLIPTVLSSYGLSLEDIGGDGDFTPPVRRYRFYSSFAFRGRLWHFGSMRFRPPLVLWGGRRDFLYHPVKSGCGGFFRAAWNLVCCAGYVSRYLLTRHNPALVRDLVRYARALLPASEKSPAD